MSEPGRVKTKAVTLKEERPNPSGTTALAPVRAVRAE